MRKRRNSLTNGDEWSIPRVSVLEDKEDEYNVQQNGLKRLNKEEVEIMDESSGSATNSFSTTTPYYNDNNSGFNGYNNDNGGGGGGHFAMGFSEQDFVHDYSHMNNTLRSLAIERSLRQKKFFFNSSNMNFFDNKK